MAASRCSCWLPRHAAANTSDDGITWTHQQSFPDDAILGVSFAGGIFFASATSGHIYTSRDGVNWSRQLVGTSESWRRVISGAGVFVAEQAWPSAGIAISSDGENWALRSSPVDTSTLIFDGTRFLGIGSLAPGSFDDELPVAYALYASTDLGSYTCLAQLPTYLGRVQSVALDLSAGAPRVVLAGFEETIVSLP